MYFLAIVTEENIKAGIIVPAYILCKSKGKSENRSGWRVTNVTSGKPCTMPKLVVNTPTGHNEMIDFLSSFRTRDHMHGDDNFDHEDTKKYYPHGALFWFECNKYGDPTGQCLYVKSVPEKRHKTDGGFEKLKEFLNTKPYLKDLLVEDAESLPMQNTDNKAILPQKSTRNYTYRYTYKKWRKYYKDKLKRKENENANV